MYVKMGLNGKMLPWTELLVKVNTHGFPSSSFCFAQRWVNFGFWIFKSVLATDSCSLRRQYFVIMLVSYDIGHTHVLIRPAGHFLINSILKFVCKKYLNVWKEWLLIKLFGWKAFRVIDREERWEFQIDHKILSPILSMHKGQILIFLFQVCKRSFFYNHCHEMKLILKSGKPKWLTRANQLIL